MRDSSAGDSAGRSEAVEGGLGAEPGPLRQVVRLLPAVWVAVLVLANLSGTPVRHSAEAVGLGQDWRLFAPDPVAEAFVLTAKIEYAGGEQVVWSVPEGGPLLPQPASRWRLWQRAVIAAEDPELLDTSARWLARAHSGRGRMPLRVTLSYRWRAVPAPGEATDRAAWNRFDLYRLSVSAPGSGARR